MQHSALMERRRMELRKSKTGILEFVSVSHVSHIIRCNSKIKIHRKTGTEAQDKVWSRAWIPISGWSLQRVKEPLHVAIQKSKFLGRTDKGQLCKDGWRGYKPEEYNIHIFFSLSIKAWQTWQSPTGTFRGNLPENRFVASRLHCPVKPLLWLKILKRGCGGKISSQVFFFSGRFRKHTENFHRHELPTLSHTSS